jgi:MoxR-like ATPase
MSAPDPRRVELAAQRFSAFFEELQQAFVERQDLLGQIALALLAREHVLMTGPPGTAKSQVAAAVLRRILDEDTGHPSLYARQFTESTVQTDLVGPIDFKTLMDTGRTEHFTDQGILGAVHAFLDEVFDGRDMLLRAALNVLHERELKEGTKVTRGAIECAIMTSNRYLAEILEGSRDTLLAFVDRIAFASFLPRGFAEPKNLATVLRRHVGGTGGAPLVRPLTVQDLDVLQAMVDGIHVSEAACDAIATFLEAFEIEIAAAAKGDPQFVPTRYVSTRTAVRCGRVLRAVVIFDRIFRDGSRPLEVLPKDFAWLRLHLLLCGPSREAVEKLLARETDPRERRQLAIIRTEREAFDRCLPKVPHFQPAARTPAPLVVALERDAEGAMRSSDPVQIVAAVRALTPLAIGGGPEATRAAGLVKKMTDGLAERALRIGLTAGLGEDATTAAAEIAELARDIEQAAPGPASRTLARSLRGRAIALLDEAILFSPGARAADTSALLGTFDADRSIDGLVETRIERIEAITSLRKRLEADGADLPTDARVLHRAHEQLEEDLALLLDAGFRWRVADVLARADGAIDIGGVVESLGDSLASLDLLAGRIARCFDHRSRLKERVVGPRIGALVAAVLGALDARDLAALVDRVEALRATLERADLGEAIAPASWLEWSARALVRADRGGASSGAPSYGAYRALRAREQRTANALGLREIGLRVAPPTGDSADDAERMLLGLLAEVPESVRRAAGEADVARIERAVDLLERWWQTLAPKAATEGDAAGRLQAIVGSRFLEVVHDEGALLRFSLEARLIAETFEAEAGRAADLRGRIEALRREVRTEIGALARSADDRAWDEILARLSPS